ncbi:hypothetical protein BBJ28_00025124 [Nothophytophthora sp. Chile5]|nr:hypothetical protein BBJ28_00027063 [Nothophytophthora sp. Chile5]RLN74598.1 hypothetical protein BBJ28_00025582 [Nothophytophthora sp. Chile5]RLN87352.1 hypothetical protein BBJ28_00025780 [Nothophytophthora sp. Chile5]RLN87444.1 hypothetical protein BBJ28_00025563 [Nothophytophthora sp. Chile5]RLN98626.1 hypothetical protein BBJ28_00025124 [Nothophytophthora sp. Chile5]
MGVLNYVTFTNDSHITSYPSEPVLAFGAASLWYQLQSAALEKYLLPRFQEMLMQRLVDIGDTGEVVARIFLLLAMDATVMLSPKGPKVLKGNFVFSGQFCTVRQFLDELGEPHVLKNSNGVTATPEQKANHDTWMDVWNDWKVGFSQFEDLPEGPTEEMLWLLLGRRSAGVLRRNQRGADLVIPIFSGNDVSFTLVQVKNRVKDKEYPASATTDLLPGNVFKETNSLEKKLPRDMIRLYITLREEATAEEPARMYVMTTRRTSARVAARQGDTLQEKPTYALCLRSVCKPLPEAKAEVDADTEAASRPWSFLPSGLSHCLEQIANAAWWDMKERVLSDVKRRDGSDFGKLLEVLSKGDLVEALECSQPIMLRDGRHAP